MNIMHFQKPDKRVLMDESEIEVALTQMEEDLSLKTVPYVIKEAPNSVRIVSFREKHAGYLKGHPKINPEHYLSNLRTTLRIRA